MFVAKIPYIDYKKPPWALSLQQRLTQWVRGKQRVIYYYEKPDSSTFRYRVYNVMQALGKANSPLSCIYFAADEFESMQSVLPQAQVLVLCRTHYSYKMHLLVTRAKELGLRVLFDVDDLVFDNSQAFLLVQAIGENVSNQQVWDYWFGYLSLQGACLRLCDGVIVTNPMLAEQVRKLTDKPTYVVSNFLNQEQLQVSQAIYKAKKANKYATHKQFHVGYFSGSPTHKKDFAMVEDSLAQVMDKHPQVLLRIVGYIHPGGPLRRHAARIELYPFQDFLNLQRLIGATELNLVPLQNNLFTNCKSNLKYFEAAITGTVTIASPTYAFAKSIVDGKNGFLALPTEWEEKIEYVLTHMQDYPAWAEASFVHAQQNYSSSAVLPAIERALLGQLVVRPVKTAAVLSQNPKIAVNTTPAKPRATKKVVRPQLIAESST